MSKVLVTESHLDNIANAIRSKNGASTTYRPGDMAAAIQAIPTGITPTGTKNITQNGTHDVTQYANANVNVPNSYAAGDEGKVVSNGALVAQTSRSVTTNGTYDTTTNDEVVVSVQPNLQSKTATENGTVTPDQGYDGLSSVVVNVSGGGGGGNGMYGFSLTGGYNGGAALLLVVDGETVCSATGSTPYNDTFSPSSGSFIVNGVTWNITISTRTQGAYVDVVITDGTNTKSITVRANGNNGSYGYNHSEWGFLT